jgi:hypothetical protein
VKGEKCFFDLIPIPSPSRSSAGEKGEKCSSFINDVVYLIPVPSPQAEKGEKCSSFIFLLFYSFVI